MVTTILISDWIPRVLTEEEQTQIKTFHKWQMKVSTKLRTMIHYMELQLNDLLTRWRLGKP